MLIPFVECSALSAAKRHEADQGLKKAMKKAGKSAGVMVALGKELGSQESSHQLSQIVERVEFSLPNIRCHRLIMSYSRLLLATFKVSHWG